MPSMATTPCQLHSGMEERTELMRHKLEARLAALKSEYEKGQSELRQLELQSASLRETLLRISGAILVLAEILSSPVSVDEERTPGVSDSLKPAASAA